MSNNYTVYMHISPSGKRYIGITCLKPQKRWKNNGKGYEGQVFYNAIEKYGWDNIEHIIIAEALTEERAKEMEIELISKYDTTNPLYGYNVSKGGDGCNGYHHTEEHKEKMSGIMKGKNATKVICLTTMKIFDTIKEASEFCNIKITKSSHISDCCKGNRKSCGKLADGTPLVWRYYEDYLLMTEEEIKESMIVQGNNGKNHSRATKVICLTTMKIFDTIKDGAEFYDVASTSISKCCKGKLKSCGKYQGKKLVWRYLNHNHNITLRGSDISKLYKNREVA